MLPHYVQTGFLLVFVSFFGAALSGAEKEELRIEPAENGTPGLVLVWHGAKDAEYDLQWSEDMVDWKSTDGFPRAGTGEFEELLLAGDRARMFYRLVRQASPEPTDFVLIPEGPFAMGDHFGEGMPSEVPARDVYIEDFYMAVYPVTWDEWRDVYEWGLENGYHFGNSGRGKAGDHPVHSISWYDMIKWCNARSELDGLEPVYYIDEGHTKVYRSGRYDLHNDQVRWEVDGYRLPTEAEWEKAARGGLEGGRFPWGDTISHNRANYWADFPASDFDESFSAGYHPAYEEGERPFTSPVGAFASNGYGLFDLAGNIWERTWDIYAEDYYADGPVEDPRGPTSGDSRVIRGGSWVIGAWNCRVSDRFFSAPGDQSNSWGFRLVRGQSR